MAFKRNYPNVHQFETACTFKGNTTTVSQQTIMPILFNDDGRGDPDQLQVHPENTNFAVDATPNCFPDSTIGRMRIKIELKSRDNIWNNKMLDGTVTPNVLATAETISGEAKHAMRFKLLPIYTAFSEDLDALDIKSTETIKSTLELQYETTTRQTYPLWNGVDMKNGTSFTATMPGIGATAIEAVAFSEDTYYNMLNYGTAKGLLKKICPGGMKWYTLTPNRPYKDVFMSPKPRSNIKRINPYTFCGVMVIFEEFNTDSQLNDQLFHLAVQDIEYADCRMEVYFEEWNPYFDMRKV